MVADPPVHRSIYPGINSSPHIDYIIDRCADWIRRPGGWVQTDCAHRRGAAAAPQLPPVNGSSCSNCCDSGQSIQHGAYCRKCKHHTRLSLVKLREHLGGRVAKHPSIAIASDRDRGLSSGDGSYGAVAHPAAVKAIAIPLREAPAGRRAENTNEHDPAIMNERRDRGLAARRRLAARPQRLQRTET